MSNDQNLTPDELVAEVTRLRGENERLKNNGVELRRQYINEIAERGERVQDLAVRLAKAERERDAERLIAERALAGNVDPVDVIQAISGGCLDNRVRVAAAEARLAAGLKLCDQYRANCDPTSTQALVAEIFRAALAVPAGTAQPERCRARPPANPNPPPGPPAPPRWCTLPAGHAERYHEHRPFGYRWPVQPDEEQR